MLLYAPFRTYIQTWRRLVAPASPTAFSRFVFVLAVAGFALFNAVLIVQALNLYHALALRVPLQEAVALQHGRSIFALEQSLHLGVEPAVQQAVAHGLPTPFGVLAGSALRNGLVWLYLHAFPAWLFAGLAWAYFYKPLQFARLRDLTIVSALLAVLCYRLYPSAPPRFVLDDAPYHLQDWTYGSTSIDPSLVHAVGFNQYAAFPSVHFLWSLIPALCLAYGSRSLGVWLVALCFPLTMALTVVATGNHYILDCVGSVSILAASAGVAWGIDLVRKRALGDRIYSRDELPAALSLCLYCAGMMAYQGIGGGVRHLIAIDILILAVIASGRSPYLWRGRRKVRDRRVDPTRFDYVAGVLFIAGSAEAAHARTPHVLLSVQICALLWLLACMSALVRHLRVRRDAVECRGMGVLRRYLPPVQRPARVTRQEPWRDDERAA